MVSPSKLPWNCHGSSTEQSSLGVEPSQYGLVWSLYWSDRKSGVSALMERLGGDGATAALCAGSLVSRRERRALVVLVGSEGASDAYSQW